MAMTNSSIKSMKMTSSKGLINKPICINCGNIARSRCPYQACQNCCARAQNPCHKHVLKATSSVTPSSKLTNQHSNEISSTLTIQEVFQINEWRSSKLREYENRSIDIENEAYDRYLENVTLLKEVFAKYESNEDESKNKTMISNLKTKFPINIKNEKEKLRFIINSGLRDCKTETPTGNEGTEQANRPKKARYTTLVELNNRLSSARTHADLKPCQLLKARLFDQHERSVENIKDDKPKENY